MPTGATIEARLRDGSHVCLRPIRAEDAPALLGLFEGFSLRSRTFRFFSAGTDLKRTAHSMAAVDNVSSYGLVAGRPGESGLIGHATYMSVGAGRAEVAFAIADEAQGLGLATLMLGHLAAVARENGISAFFAEVLPANLHMLEVFEDSGFAVTATARRDAIRLEFPTGPPPLAIRHFAELAGMSGGPTEADPY